MLSVETTDPGFFLLKIPSNHESLVFLSFTLLNVNLLDFFHHLWNSWPSTTPVPFTDPGMCGHLKIEVFFSNLGLVSTLIFGYINLTLCLVSTFSLVFRSPFFLRSWVWVLEATSQIWLYWLNLVVIVTEKYQRRIISLEETCWWFMHYWF